MGDKIAIFRAGKIEQVDGPDTVLAHPANAFVADFVGADRTLKRLRLVSVEEVADVEAPAVSRHAKVRDVKSAMLERKAAVAVLIDGDRRPVGFVSEEMIEGASGVVQDVARPLPATVPARADLRAVVSEMFAHDVMWLVCVDDTGRFAGVVTQAAVTRVLGQTYHRDDLAVREPAE